MKPAVLRLILSAFLFLGWIGWLVYLTTTLPETEPLSRPQLLRADLDAIARVDRVKDGSPSATIDVVEITWASDQKDRDLKQIKVENLPDLGIENGWKGPGLYILPLVRKTGNGAVEYRVAEIPRSPGYPRGRTSGPPLIYRATDDARRQLTNIRNGEWE